MPRSSGRTSISSAATWKRGKYWRCRTHPTTSSSPTRRKCWKRSRRLPLRLSADLEQHFTEHASGFDAPVCGRRVCKAERGSDRHFEWPCFHGLVELLPLRHPVIRERVERNNGDAFSRLRNGLDAIGIGDLATGAQAVDAFLERITAREREHGVDALRRELACLRENVALAPIDDHVRTEPLDQRDTFVSRRCREYARTAQLGELHAQRAHRAACAM